MLGQDGQHLLIRHTSAYYRERLRQLMKKRNTCATGTEIKRCRDGKSAHSPNIAVEQINKNDDTDSEIDNAHKSTPSGHAGNKTAGVQ